MAIALASVAREAAPAAPSPAASLALARPTPAAAASAPANAIALSLTLPAGVIDAELSAMPDRYVNEPLPASFRVPLSIRGYGGVASVDPPAAIIWTEGGISYALTSRVRSIPQLVELALRLR